VLGGTGGGDGWPGKWSETVGKTVRKFAVAMGTLCRLIVGEVLGKFLRLLLTQ